MQYLSICSGIEAFSVAVQGLDFEPVGFAEIEPFPCEVLRQRFPGVPNLGDVHGITKEAYPALSFELLVGGTPCQSFSIAGKREGLRGLSGLALEYVRIAAEFRPQWLLWENVPGCLSSDGGRDFYTFASSLVKLGYHVCWRVLDSEFFGVAQKRRRVYLVGSIRDREDPVKVLFELESLSGNHPESGAVSEEATGGAGQSAAGPAGYPCRMIKRTPPQFVVGGNVFCTVRAREAGDPVNFFIEERT